MYCYSLVAAVLILASISIVSPVQGEFLSSKVQGPALINDLILAYAVPAVMILALFRSSYLLRWIGGGLVAHWGFLAIRHFWQGPETMGLSYGVVPGELYSYSVAILLAGAAALVRALQSGQPGWRKLGMGLIALATLKAFVYDASELDGLLRVFGFLAMGLALAGLAWVNRWVMARERGSLETSDQQSP